MHFIAPTVIAFVRDCEVVAADASRSLALHQTNNIATPLRFIATSLRIIAASLLHGLVFADDRTASTAGMRCACLL